MTVSSVPSSLPARPQRWSLWCRQLLAILKVELWKSFFGRRSLPVYLVAGVPIFLMLMVALIPHDQHQNMVWARRLFANVYQTVIVRAILFFGCMAIFTNLFRGEVLDRSLHYYFLSPLRRPILALSKYLSGLIVTVTVFGVSTVVSFCLVYLPVGLGRLAEDMISGPGLSQLMAYVSVTTLACVGYGALFLLIGILFRNPIIPSAILLGWEGIQFLLPPVLKRISVNFYLKGFYPIPMSEGPFAIVAEPPTPWLSAIGLILFAALVVVVASVYLHRMQIRYSED